MKQPQLMGILNLTPDSFSDGGLFNTPEVALQHVGNMIEQGAQWIDVGGESTRPGAQAVPVDEELHRVLPVIRGIKEVFPNVQVSVDTRKSIVAHEAVYAGASMINDVSAGLHDEAMFEVAAKANVPMVLMHMRGDPQTMQQDPHYTNVVETVVSFLEERTAVARAAGITTVYVDPGIGFGKTTEHNLALLQHLEKLRDVADGVVLGISRKRFLGAITGVESPRDRDVHTALMHALLWSKGASIIRVHDVALHAQLQRLAEAVSM